MRHVRISVLVVTAAAAGLAFLAWPNIVSADDRHRRNKSYGVYLGPGGIGVSVGRGYGYSPYFDFYYGPRYDYYGYYPGPYGYYNRGFGPGPYYYDIPSVANMYREVREPKAETFFYRAEAAFRQGNYEEAVRLAQHATVEMPRSGKLFLFLSQSLFAVGNYGGAAEAAHRGMSLLDEKDWGWVVENFRRYYSNTDYVDQVKRLENFVAENPNAGEAHFLLGYHYGFLDYPAEARRELTRARELGSDAGLSARLLARFGGTPGPAPRPSVLVPELPSPPSP